jgi:MFS family permease
MLKSRWLTRDSLYLCLSAFFADMGYQAVSAVFPVLLVIELKQPAYLLGLILGLSFGAGSFWSYVGGKLGDYHSKKLLSIAGNLMIPLMSFSILATNVVIIALLFILGWWGRYFRTPTRRAWLVEVTEPAFRTKVFGFLHALDIGGGIIAVAYSIAMILLGYSLKAVMLVTALPLFISTLFLVMAGTSKNKNYNQNEVIHAENQNEDLERAKGRLFMLILISATLFGFSYYSFGFPIVTIAESNSGSLSAILSFGIYLSVSALSGYSLGSAKNVKGLRVLWSYGYLAAAISSAIIGIAYGLHFTYLLYLIGAAGLGFATGAIETFEPVIVSKLGSSSTLSGRMGWLSSSRAIGLFVSNAAMGIIFQFSQFTSYTYASLTSLIAALILVYAESKSPREIRDKL